MAPLVHRVECGLEDFQILLRRGQSYQRDRVLAAAGWFAKHNLLMGGNMIHSFTELRTLSHGENVAN